DPVRRLLPRGARVRPGPGQGARRLEASFGGAAPPPRSEGESLRSRRHPAGVGRRGPAAGPGRPDVPRSCRPRSGGARRGRWAGREARRAEAARAVGTRRPWQDLVGEWKADHPSREHLVEEYRREVGRAREFTLARGLVTLPEGETLRVVETPSFQRSVTPF